MDTIDFSRFAFAFVFVLSLIALMAYLLKRYGHSRRTLGNLFGTRVESGRLELLEVRYIDSRRRLVLIRRDDVEHLLLLSEQGDLVIESGMKSTMITDSNLSSDERV